MTPLQITVDLARTPWDDVDLDVEMLPVARLGMLPHGTSGGKPIIVLAIPDPIMDGHYILACTTYRLLRAAARVFAATPAAILMEVEETWRDGDDDD